MPDKDLNCTFAEDTPSKASGMMPTHTLLPTPDIQSHSDNTHSDVNENLPTSSSLYLKSICRPKPPTSACLDKNLVEVNGLYFQKMADAEAAMNDVQWRAPVFDSTIPQTDKDHQHVVKKLLWAFKDMSMAKDTAENAYRKRLTPGEASYYQDWAIEACAWDVVRMAKSIHTDGFRVPIYDKNLVNYIGQTQEWTFQERINWICTVLRASKNVAANLMKNEKVWNIIGAPHKMYQSTLTNTIANANRGAWVKSGRQADTEHQARVSKRRKTVHSSDNQNDGIGNASDTGNKASKPRSDAATELDQFRKLMDTPVNPSQSSNDATTTPQAPVPSLPVDNATPTPSSAISFSSFTDYERDAEIIALMHGPLPKGDDEQQGSTKRRSGKTINKNDIAEQVSGTNNTSSKVHKTLATFPLAARSTKAESGPATSHAHASSSTKLDVNNKGSSSEPKDRDHGA
ncbi:hypothetical protein J3E72DRAFT_372474 [Bipolaris maydis]|nr:hypothetical protein J3E72DRAFT_372474 [Bipolaris maydis]